MFEVDQGLATQDRVSSGHLVGEVVATAGLVALIVALARTGRTALAAPAAGAYIGAAGIAPGSVPAYVGLQLVGLAVGVALTLALYPRPRTR
ncbi:hypothetical protein [Pimelobacter simplex]|uniref:hypothetical protein n=1 Tax=Nocardioides simplex TaxID=2045 RepID=UPI003AAEF11B